MTHFEIIQSMRQFAHANGQCSATQLLRFTDALWDAEMERNTRATLAQDRPVAEVRRGPWILRDAPGFARAPDGAA